MQLRNSLLTSLSRLETRTSDGGRASLERPQPEQRHALVVRGPNAVRAHDLVDVRLGRRRLGWRSALALLVPQRLRVRLVGGGWQSRDVTCQHMGL